MVAAAVLDCFTNKSALRWVLARCSVRFDVDLKMLVQPGSVHATERLMQLSSSTDGYILLMVVVGSGESIILISDDGTKK